MKVGLFHTVQWPEGTSQQERYSESLEQALAAENLGFDSVWLTEHHFFRHGIISDGASVLGYLAARTSSIRLGTAVAVLPLHNPVRLAESVATLDLLSGGRLDLGVGKGYQVGEFKGLGVDLEMREQRFQESLNVLLRSWTTDEPFSHTGEAWTFEDANPQPKPLQRPHPPIWMATDSDSGFARCAQEGFGLLLPQGNSPEAVANQLARYKDALAAAGRSYDPDKVILARPLYVGPTDQEAWDSVAGPYTEFVRRATSLAAPGKAPSSLPKDPFSLDSELRKSALFGSPETCLNMLSELADLGIARIIGFVHIGGLQHEQIMDSLELFAREVLPNLPSADDASESDTDAVAAPR